MTKLKSKKMTKSTFAVIIMAIIMVAMIAFGGTYAYFTATSTQDNKSLTTGYLKIKDNNAIKTINLTNVFPTQTLIDAEKVEVTVQTNDDAGNYVAIKIKFDVYNYKGEKITMPSHEGETWDKKISTGNAAWGDTFNEGGTPTDKASWDRNGDGYWDEGNEAEGVKKPELGDYIYDGANTLENAPNNTLYPDQAALTTAYTKYENTLKTYKADLAAYNKKASAARLLSSLNTDSILEGSPLEYGPDGNKTEYYWTRMCSNMAGGDELQNIYAVTDDTGAFLAVGAADDDYAEGENSGNITLIVNAKPFTLPAAVADNWDEGYDPAGEEGLSDSNEKDEYKQHSEAGLMNGTIVISFQAVSVQATGMVKPTNPDGSGPMVQDYATISKTLKDMLDSKWTEQKGPGVTNPDDMGETW